MYNIIVYVSKSWRFIGMETNNKNYAREQSNESSELSTLTFGTTQLEVGCCAGLRNQAAL